MTKLFMLSALLIFAQMSMALPVIVVDEARYDAWEPVIEPIAPHEELHIEGAKAVAIVQALQIRTMRKPPQPDPEMPGMIDPAITEQRAQGVVCIWTDDDVKSAWCNIFIDGRSGLGIQDLSPSTAANLEIDFVGQDLAGKLFASFPPASEKKNEQGEITRQVPGMVCTQARCRVLLDSASGVLR